MLYTLKSISTTSFRSKKKVYYDQHCLPNYSLLSKSLIPMAGFSPNILELLDLLLLPALIAQKWSCDGISSRRFQPAGHHRR